MQFNSIQFKPNTMQSNTVTDTSSGSTLDDLMTNWENKNYQVMAGNIISALGEHGSDSVRGVLNRINRVDRLDSALSNMFKEQLGTKIDDREKLKYMLGVPFFCLGPQQAEVGKTTSTKRMSDAVSNVDRACTREFLRFKVHFDQFDVDAELKASKFHPAIEDAEDIKLALVATLRESFNAAMSESTLETSEVIFTFNVLNRQLEFFGYEIQQLAVPDFKINKKTSTPVKTVIHGEAKQVMHLPQKPIRCDLSAHLCRFGFASMIARNTYNDTKWKPEGLLNLLGLTDKKRSKATKGTGTNGKQMSEMVKGLLKFSDETLGNEKKIDIDDIGRLLDHGQGTHIQRKVIKSAGVVRSSLIEEKIVPTDAVNLWCATMQACEASYGIKMRFTIVMSARIMWFVKLDIEDKKCIASFESVTVCALAKVDSPRNWLVSSHLLTILRS